MARYYKTGITKIYTEKSLWVEGKEVTDSANCLLIDGELHAIYYCSTDSAPCVGAFRIRKAHVCSLNDFFTVLSTLLGRTFHELYPGEKYTWDGSWPAGRRNDAVEIKGGWAAPHRLATD